MMTFELVCIIISTISFGNNALDLVPVEISVTFNVTRNFIGMCIHIEVLTNHIWIHMLWSHQVLAWIFEIVVIVIIDRCVRYVVIWFWIMFFLCFKTWTVIQVLHHFDEIIPVCVIFIDSTTSNLLTKSVIIQVSSCFIESLF